MMKPLSHLPERASRWLFHVGSRSLELLNISALLGWAYVLFTQADAILALRPYAKFGDFPLNGAALLMVLIALGLGLCMRKNSSQQQLLGGYCLLLAAGIWGITCANFIRSYPPLNTGVILYFSLMWINWWAGLYKIERAKKARRRFKQRYAQ